MALEVQPDVEFDLNGYKFVNTKSLNFPFLKFSFVHMKKYFLLCHTFCQFQFTLEPQNFQIWASKFRLLFERLCHLSNAIPNA